MDELQGLQMYWQLHSTSRYHSGDSRPVDPDYLRQTDDEVSRRWDDLRPKIIKAIDRALERMSASGPNEISPNEKNAFKTRLQQTMTMAKTRPTVDDLKAMKIDNNRFEPLLNLLGDLLKKLGDFPER
jgi:hypothetical protein